MFHIILVLVAICVAIIALSDFPVIGSVIGAIVVMTIMLILIPMISEYIAMAAIAFPAILIVARLVELAITSIRRMS